MTVAILSKAKCERERCYATVVVGDPAENSALVFSITDGGAVEEQTAQLVPSDSATTASHLAAVRPTTTTLLL